MDKTTLLRILASTQGAMHPQLAGINVDRTLGKQKARSATQDQSHLAQQPLSVHQRSVTILASAIRRYHERRSSGNHRAIDILAL